MIDQDRIDLAGGLRRLWVVQAVFVSDMPGRVDVGIESLAQRGEGEAFQAQMKVAHFDQGLQGVAASAFSMNCSYNAESTCREKPLNRKRAGCLINPLDYAK